MISEDYKFVYNYHSYLKYLPKAEQELLEYLKKGMKQKTIGSLMRISQGAVSSRIQRIKKRLNFIQSWEKFKIIDSDLERLTPLNREILKILSMTTCQSETALLINERFHLTGRSKMTQVKIRHRFERSLQEIEEWSKEEKNYIKYIEFFTLIKNNLYLLHEVRLPQFER